MLGIEFGQKKNNVIHLFSAGIDFLHRPRGEYQRLIESFALIQLNKYHVNFDQIECEPELIFLKKFLGKKIKATGDHHLFLILREYKPILKRPIEKHDTILLI